MTLLTGALLGCLLAFALGTLLVVIASEMIAAFRQDALDGGTGDADVTDDPIAELVARRERFRALLRDMRATAHARPPSQKDAA